MGNLATTLPVWRSALVDVRAPRCSGVPVDHHDRDRVHGEASTVNLGARRVWRECLAKNEKKKEEKETDRTSSQTHTGSSHMYCAPTHRGGHVMCTTLLPGSGAGTCARGKNRTGPRTVGGVVAPPTTTRADGRPSRKQYGQGRRVHTADDSDTSALASVAVMILNHNILIPRHVATCLGSVITATASMRAAVRLYCMVLTSSHQLQACWGSTLTLFPGLAFGVYDWSHPEAHVNVNANVNNLLAISI